MNNKLVKRLNDWWMQSLENIQFPGSYWSRAFSNTYARLQVL
jgi:hypothetical protein